VNCVTISAEKTLHLPETKDYNPRQSGLFEPSNRYQVFITLISFMFL